MKHNGLPFKIGFLLLAMGVSVGFGIYLSVNRVTNPFLYVDVAFVKSSISEDQIVFPEVGPYGSLDLVRGRQILIAQFTNMMGIPPETLQYLPLGAVFVSLTFFLLAQKVLDSPLLACMLAIYLMLNLSHASSLYSIFAYALGLPIFIGLFVLCIQFMESRDFRTLPILVLLLLGLNVIHYTLTAWIILLLIGINLTIEFTKLLVSNESRLRLMPMHYLSVAFIVIFLAFNGALYQSYIPGVAIETINSAVQQFLAYLFLGPDSFIRSPYPFTRASDVNLISTLTLLVTLIPIGIGFAIDVWKLIFKRSSLYIEEQNLPITWGILLMGVVDSFAYSIRGSISTKSFSIIFPLLTLLYVKRTGIRVLYYGMAILLVITSLVKIPIFYRNSYEIIGYGTSSYRLEPSSQWIQEHITQSKYLMLADLALYGKYLVASAQENQEPLFQGYSLELFKDMVGESDDGWEIEPDIIAIDLKSSQPTIGFIWKRFAPLTEFTGSIIKAKD